MDCSVKGCLRPVFAKEVCHAHYEEQRAKSLPPCVVVGCSNRQHAQGLCHKHYRADLRKRSEPCIVVNCERPQIANGLCDAHRKRQERHGHLDPTRPADWGGKESHPLYHRWGWFRKQPGLACQEWIDDFWAFADCVGHPPSARHQLKRFNTKKPFGPDNYHWVENTYLPTEGETKKERNRRQQKQYREKDPERYKKYNFKRLYGITVDQFEKMNVAQNGVCAICKKAETVVNRITGEPVNLSVDHDHKTGKIRSLLCAKCNTGLGAFNDSTALMKKAIRYLERHR